MASLAHLASGQFDDDGENEFFCDDCGARCTRNTTSGIEYGHLIGCPQRPEHLADCTESHSHIYQPDPEADNGEGGASA